MQCSHSEGFIDETDSERQPISKSHVVKPLPPLPHGWSRVCHETGLLLRSIGLGIVVTAFQGFFNKNFQEPEKIAIRRSRVTAVLRTLLHAVPLAVAIFEIVLNFKGRYAGKQFDKQNYLQFAAKAHEITMQASIATILLSYIRFQISTGKGMPFGAVLGGLQFLQVGYLWSSELWSSILSKEFQLRKKICFVSLIFVCVTIAATAGPSSANLLIARQDLWPTGSKYIAINTTFQELWPDRLSGEEFDRSCAVIVFDSVYDTARCPLSDLYALLNTDAYEPLVDSDLKVFSTMSLQHPETTYLRLLDMAPCFTFKNQACATIPQTALLDPFIQNVLNETDRSDRYGERHRLDAYQVLQKGYYQPYTAASCVFDVAQNISDDAPLQFPRILETTSDLREDRAIVSIQGLTLGQIINDISDDNSHFRVHWIDLPQNIFGTGIPGAVIVTPQGPKGPPYNIYQCTFNAGWGSSAILSDSERPGSVISHRTDYHSGASAMGNYDAFGYIYATVPDFTNASNLLFPEQRISVSKSWMEFLNPTMVLADNSTTTLISRYLSLSKLQLEEARVARMFSILISIALSNTIVQIGAQVFDESNDLHPVCNNCLVFEIENSIYGWLYSASGTTTKLAITVMLAYCVLVLGHIIYSTISGISSTAWDSTTEFVALTMNSSPTKILQNTCAGIIGSTALKTLVRVLATT